MKKKIADQAKHKSTPSLVTYLKNLTATARHLKQQIDALSPEEQTDIENLRTPQRNLLPGAEIQTDITDIRHLPRRIAKAEKTINEQFKSTVKNLTWLEYFQILWNNFFNKPKQQTVDQKSSILFSEEPYRKPR